MKASLPNRKKTAVKRITLALLTFFLASHFFSLTLLPIQAVRSAEESEGTGKTAFVTSLSWEYRDQHYRVQLRQNENALLLVGLRPSLLGGWDGFSQALDCSLTEKTLSVAELLYSNHAQEKTALYYGRVTDDAIHHLTIDLSLEYRTNGNKTTQHIRTLEIGPEDLREQDGARYFLFPCEPFPYDGKLPRVRTVLTAHDAGGSVIIQEEL